MEKKQINKLKKLKKIKITVLQRSTYKQRRDETNYFRIMK